MSADYIGEKNVAISGIGQSEVGRPSQQSAMQLTADACFKALADAGLTKDEIAVSYTPLPLPTILPV